MKIIEIDKDLTVQSIIQSGPEKNAQSLMHRHFATVCSRIMRFSLKCSEKITVYQSMQNLYQLVKYSLRNNRNWIRVVSVEMFSVNFVTFAFRILFFCHDSLQNVAGIDAF